MGDGKAGGWAAQGRTSAPQSNRAAIRIHVYVSWSLISAQCPILEPLAKTVPIVPMMQDRQIHRLGRAVRIIVFWPDGGNLRIGARD
jgi:hypothetical protein